MTKSFEDQMNELATPVQEVIKEAFEKRISEAREEIYAKARKELNEKYKADMDAMVEGVEKFIAESIAEKCADLKESTEKKNQAIKLMKEGMEKLESTVSETLAEEVKNIKDEKAVITEKLAGFDSFVKSNLVEYVQDLESEKKKYIESTAKVVEDGLKLNESAKSSFVKAASSKAADVILESLESEINGLKSEIKEAQQNSFGQRLFEMFSGEFKALFLNENEEIKKIREEKALVEANLSKATKLIESKNNQVSALKESLETQKELRKRDAIIAEASKGLSETKREVLKRMVESVSTDKLEKVISDYIPAVIGQQKQVKRFSESVKPAKLTVKTGDKKIVTESVKKEVSVNKINNEINNIELDEEFMDRMLGL